MKRPALFVALVLLAASCGGTQPAAPVRSLELSRSFDLPSVRPAEPAYGMVFSQRAPRRVVSRVDRVPGLVAVTVQRRTLKVASLTRVVKLRVAAIKPLAYRNVAPEVTRAAEFVWTSLLRGRAVVAPVAAQKLKLDGATDLVIGNETLRIGAFADMAVPNLADIYIPAFKAGTFDLGPARSIVVGARKKTGLDELRDRLERIAPAARLRSLAPGGATRPPEPTGTASGSLIGAMTYRIRKDGFVEPDPAWVEANIATATVPIIGTVMCHRLLIPQLGEALAEIEREGLAGLIDPSQYGGCYVPRFIARDPRRGLSLHAFGLAVDMNVKGNYYGTRGNMDPRIVAIFDKWGFAWGGRWSTPDPMHFELARLIQP